MGDDSERRIPLVARTSARKTMRALCSSYLPTWSSTERKRVETIMWGRSSIEDENAGSIARWIAIAVSEA
eukprot:6071655-Prymnesium_polylepis.1